MKIVIELPDTLPEGHGRSFKKGLADALLKGFGSELGHTPNGQELSRKKGQEVGAHLSKLVSGVVKKSKA